MLSFWPFKQDDTSPASFEKTLSVLSNNISKSQVKLDSLRQNNRRFGLLWLLYSVFAYILLAAFLALAVGWKNWGIIEYTGVSGGPLLIYLVKAAFTALYAYRIESVTRHLEVYQAEREKTIEKLKAATKYNSTQQLLEKYGGAPSRLSPASGGKTKERTKSNPRNGTNMAPRTGMGPPPTANIPRSPQSSPPLSPQPFTVANASDPAIPLENRKPSLNQARSPEFAPNAFMDLSTFPGPPRRVNSSHSSQSSNWYDRILDAIIGEDETLAKNRLALICENCRLVLGQAQPGVKRLEDIGKWRCGACGAWNGVEDEGKKIVEEMRQQENMDLHNGSEPVIESIETDDPIGVSSGGDGDDEMQAEDYDDEEEEGLPAATTTTKKVKSKTSRKK